MRATENIEAMLEKAENSKYSMFYEEYFKNYHNSRANY